MRCSPVRATTTAAGSRPRSSRSALTSTAGVDADRLLVSGNVLAALGSADCSTCSPLVLTENRGSRQRTIATEREREIERLTISRFAQCRGGRVRRLAERMWGKPPPTRSTLPTAPIAVAATDRPAQVARRCTVLESIPVDAVPHPGRRMSRRKRRVARFRPERALAGVDGLRGDTRACPSWPTPTGRPLCSWSIRPGSVQTSLRMATMAAPREDPEWPALQLAKHGLRRLLSPRAWTEKHP